MNHPMIEYLATISIRNADRRAERLASLVADDVVYIHAHAPEVIRGRGELEGLLQQFALHKPTTIWEPVGDPEIHHNAFRLRYRTLDRGVVVTEGTYCGQSSFDGRLQLILGFIDSE